MSVILRIFSIVPLLLAGACVSQPAKNPYSLSPSRATLASAAPYATTARPVIAQPPQPARNTGLPNLFPSSLPSVRADSLILIDARDGQVLAQKNADDRRAVASTQKLLTALVVLDAGDIDRQVTIQKSDTLVEPSKLYLRPGERYTRRELLNAILVKSANDAAAALARDNAGSIDAFAERMNAKAYQLGARSSHFCNPHGLTESGQYSTARDVARIAYVAHRNPFIRRAVTQKNYTFQTPRGAKRLENTNKLLGRMGACTGMKTGYTRASGRCLVTSANVNGRPVILVQLGSETRYIFDDAERLMNWGGGQSAGAQFASFQPPS